MAAASVPAAATTTLAAAAAAATTTIAGHLRSSGATQAAKWEGSAWGILASMSRKSSWLLLLLLLPLL